MRPAREPRRQPSCRHRAGEAAHARADEAHPARRPPSCGRLRLTEPRLRGAGGVATAGARRGGHRRRGGRAAGPAPRWTGRARVPPRRQWVAPVAVAHEAGPVPRSTREGPSSQHLRRPQRAQTAGSKQAPRACSAPRHPPGRPRRRGDADRVPASQTAAVVGGAPTARGAPGRRLGHNPAAGPVCPRKYPPPRMWSGLAAHSAALALDARRNEHPSARRPALLQQHSPLGASRGSVPRRSEWYLAEPASSADPPSACAPRIRRSPTVRRSRRRP
eukprot:scaffold14098_cov129-Isochrysis_galbana.AAC.8